MNTDLLRDVRDQIATEPERFDMSHWYGSGAGPTPADACGTTACIAGWALALNESTKHLTLEFESWRIGGRSTSNVAAEVLRLSERQAHRLFHLGVWPYHYIQMAEDETQAKAAVSLLDDILDGLTVWDEDRFEWVYLPDDLIVDEEVPV